MTRLFFPFLVSLALAVPAAAFDAVTPPLPEGLEDTKDQEKKEEPALPPGLFGEVPPSLPPGLGGTPDNDAANKMVSRNSGFLGLNLTGFTETRLGFRTQSDPNQKAASIAEARLQLSFEKAFSLGTLSVTGDLLFDPVAGSYTPRLESGRGAIDLREANFLARPTSFADLKIGRQVLTWGTGDLLFINDMFPKDWNAFFIGRDEEYLKAPSDAIKLAMFSDFANLDVVYTPRFDADRYIDGRRLSYFHPGYNSVVGRNAVVNANRPDNWFSEDEIALRLHRNIGAAEVAVYFYDGYQKSPNGMDPVLGQATFPRLRTYGASLRKPMFSGIANVEVGFYDSRDDSAGTNPFVPNGEFRFLAGYERELASELTGSVQYYLEHMADYDAYRATLPAGFAAKDKNRHVLTARLTKLAMNQTLTWSLFAYFSPSDQDAYLRPKVSYKLTDAWLLEGGANWFIGKNDYSFFGQFERNSNIFAAVRYSF